jgi:hypothetical protein
MNEYNIYPKQYQHANIPIEKNKCFVIMPFKDEFDYIYGIIKEGLNNSGFTCNRVDEITGSVPIVAKILNEILSSRYIIADLSGCNPNVFYELGVSHSFKDAHNIIILKKKDSKVPFDIMHLTYIEYSDENPKLLVTRILKSIEDVKYVSDFQEILNIKGIIPFVSDENSNFTNYLKQKLNKQLITITQILQEGSRAYENNNIEIVMQKYINVLIDILYSKQEYIDIAFILFYEMIKSISDTECAIALVQAFIDNSFFAQNNINDSRIIIWQTDLCIKLAESKKMLHIVLPWIINYFSRTKTATIDLNRYKLEAFLVTTNEEKVNIALCNAVMHENCYIRENISDIIGERKLYMAKSILLKQLAVEENYYTAISIIEALGKIGDYSCIDSILHWTKEHEKNVILQKQFFVLKHIRIALVKLDDNTHGTVKKFDEKYGSYLENYFYL